MPYPELSLSADSQFYDMFKDSYPQVLQKTPPLTNLAQKYTRNIFAKLLADGSRHYPVAGRSIEWPVLVDYGSGVRFVHWAAEDAVSFEDNVRIATEKVVHGTWNVAWFRQEMLTGINQGVGKAGKAQKLFDLMRSRMIQRQQGVLADMEDRMWSGPSTTAEAERYPKSVPFWIQKCASGTDQGFVGGNPSGFSSGRGMIDSDTYTNFKNYAGLYDEITDDDLIEKMRLMEMEIRFEKPEAIVDDDGALETPDPVYYTTKNVILGVSKVMRQNLENITDAAGPDPLFKRKSMMHVPALDSDSSDPIYAIETRDLKLAYQVGDFLHVTGPDSLERQHNGFVQHWDLSWQLLVSNPRLHGVLSKDN